MARLPLITSKDQVAPKDHAVVDDIVKSRGGIHGPFNMFLHSPELAGRVAHLGAFVRFEGSLDMRVRVLAAMTAARELDAVYVWGAQTGWRAPAGRAGEHHHGHPREAHAAASRQRTPRSWTSRASSSASIASTTPPFKALQARVRQRRPDPAHGGDRLLQHARHDRQRLRARGGARRRGADGLAPTMANHDREAEQSRRLHPARVPGNLRRIRRRPLGWPFYERARALCRHVLDPGRAA